MKEIMLYPNPTRDIGLKYSAKVAEILNQSNITATMPEHVVEGYDIPQEAFCNINLLPLEQAIANADMVISLGGDGSILHTAKQAAVHNIPVLGINVGRMGYMAELEIDELSELQRIIKGEYSTVNRMMLDVEIHRNGEIIFKDSGLNDVVLIKNNYAQIVDLDMYTDGFFISHYKGDGVIVATPTGSTAYSMSAGGPIVDPLSENLIITPVCTHSLSAKPIVVSPKRVITVEALSQPSGTICVNVDGGSAQLLDYGDKVVIKRSKLVTQLVRIKNKNFYDILCSKLSDRRFGDI